MELNRTYTIRVLINNRLLTYTGKIISEDNFFVTFLDKYGKSVSVNKNTIPNETESPFVTSGIRIGTPAATTRGMDKKAMEEIADMITTVIENIKDEKLDPKIAKKVSKQRQDLCKRFPLYPEL